jgi:hypothetical protein
MKMYGVHCTERSFAMSTGDRTGWVIVSDSNGQPYWERRIGDVFAVVQRVQLNGDPAWRYFAGTDRWNTEGYKDTVRSAKLAATKAAQWYALRQDDFKRVERKLRLLWLEQGLEDVEPDRRYPYPWKAEHWYESGICWTWDYDLTMWRSGAWRLWYNQSRGWMLRYPDDSIQTLHVTSRYDAMREAAWWINLAVRE